jgi:ABC-2 type transport system ATP-binding protein
MEISDALDKKTQELSKGMQQKIQFIATLLHDPELIIMDEPFSGLDPVNQAVLQDEILAAARRGSNILFSTHVMEHAERLCTRLIMLARGQKVFDGDREQARAMLPGRIRLRAKGDPSGLPGVAQVEQLPASEDGWTDWQIVLKPGSEPGDLLQACIERGFALRDFEAQGATLHDVFLHLAGPQAGDRP